jgi:hypothetical protein
MVLNGRYTIINIVSQKPVVGVGLLGGIRPPIIGLPRELAMAEHVGSSFRL